MPPASRFWISAVIAGCAGAPPAAREPAAHPPEEPAPAAGEPLAEPNRPLTSGEIAMLRPIFRDGIDYASVRVIDNSFPLQPENVYMTPRGHVYAPGTLFHDDFSTTGSGLRETFVHEMTHVWQHANGMDLIGQSLVEFAKYNGDYERAYPYELEHGRDLVDYGMEQQASIVEDFFAITVDNELPHRITNHGLTDGDRDRLYAAVLGKFLGDARYARALDARAIAGAHAKASERHQPGPAACKESEQEHGAAHMCEWRFRPKRK